MIYQPRVVDSVCYVFIKSLNKNEKPKPIVRSNLSKAEKEFNKVIKNISPTRDIFNNDYDPFISDLYELERLAIKVNKKSSTLVYNTGYWENNKTVSLEHLQNKRFKTLKNFPFRHTFSIEKNEEYKKLKKFLETTLTKDEYFIISLGQTDFFTICIDVYFRTAENLKKFLEGFVIGGFSAADRFYFKFNKESNNLFQLKNALRHNVYGDNLKILLADWTNIYQINGDVLAYNKHEKVPGLVQSIGVFSIFEKIKIVHDWCLEHMEKRFLVMGGQSEIWLFESEEDMNYFTIMWLS